MTEAFDPSHYLRSPRLDVRGALGLGKMLLQVVPKPAPPGVVRKALALRGAVEGLDEAFKRSGRGAPPVDLRPFDHRLDRIWTAIRDRLATYGVLPDSDYKQQALELQARLFGGGLAFLRLPFLSRHAESEKRLSIIDDEGWDEVLEALVDPLFVEELRAAHAAYGEALGITRANDPSDETVQLVEPMRAVTQAISTYALHVLAFATEDEANERAARRALEPIDRVRRAAARRARPGTEPEPDAEIDDELLPESPVPTVLDGDAPMEPEASP